ncbi:MAG: YfhO family protein [Limisphaerales bacterium]
MTSADTNAKPETPNSERLLSPARFAALLAALVFAAWPDVLLGSATFVLRDFSVFGYPLAHYHRECFWRGELPLWNPLNNCGLPFLAQWNTMTLYPGSLLYLLAPLPWSLGLFMLLHLWLGGLGAYAVARRWTGQNFPAAVAGVAYAFHGLTQQSLMWPNNLAALGLLPWVVLTTDSAVREGGRKLVLAALVGAAQMLTGAPEVILFTWCIAALLALGEGKREKEKGKSDGHERLRPFAFCLFTFALAALLSAAQLLPFLELLRHSQRDAGCGDAAGSLPARRLANFLVPHFRCVLTTPGVPLHSGQNWTSSYYAGAGVLALALVAVLRVSDRRSRALSLLAGVFVVLALGDDGGLFAALKHVLPLGVMRYPVKFVIPLTFILPMLAAFAVKEIFRDVVTDNASPVDALEETRARMARHRLRAIATVLVAVIALIAVLGWFNPLPRESADAGLLLLFNALASGVFLAFTAAAVLNLRTAPAGWRATLWALAVLGLLYADLRLHLPNLTPRVAPAYLQPGQPDLAALTPAPRNGTARASLTWAALKEFKSKMLPSLADTLLLQRVGLYDNLNLLDGLAKTDGIFSLYLRPQQEVEARLFLGGATNSLPGPLADFLGIAHVNSPTNIFKWHRRDTALLLITAGQRVEFAAAEIALPAMTATNWNPAELVFLHPWDKALVPTTNAADAKVLSTRWTAHHIACEVESPAPTLVVIAQAHYPAWRATVNGQPANLLRANHAFPAVPVPAGRSTVRLDYVDRRFQLSVALSALGLIACVVLWWRRAERNVT